MDCWSGISISHSKYSEIHAVPQDVMNKMTQWYFLCSIFDSFSRIAFYIYSSIWLIFRIQVRTVHILFWNSSIISVIIYYSIITVEPSVGSVPGPLRSLASEPSPCSISSIFSRCSVSAIFKDSSKYWSLLKLHFPQ